MESFAQQIASQLLLIHSTGVVWPNEDEITIEIPVQNLGDTSMTDSQLSADHTRPHPSSSHLNYLESDMIGKRTAIDENSSKLVDPALALEGVAGEERGHGRGGQRRVAAEGLQLVAAAPGRCRH